MKNILKNNIPIFTFLSRSWLVLALALFFIFLCNWSHAVQWVDSGSTDEWGNVFWRGVTLFEYCGAILYIPALILSGAWCGALVKHLVHRETIDKDIHDGTYKLEWRSLTPFQRICVSNAVSIGYTIAAAIIAASLAK